MDNKIGLIIIALFILIEVFGVIYIFVNPSAISVEEPDSWRVEEAMIEQAIYDEYYEEGYNEGYHDGLERGWENGYDDGFYDGYAEGYDDGASGAEKAR